MDISLPSELTERLQQEVAYGHYPSTNAVIEHAVRRFFEEQHRGADRLEALRRIGAAVDQAGLYERVLLPDSERRVCLSSSWTLGFRSMPPSVTPSFD